MALGLGLEIKADLKQVDQFLELSPKKTSLAVFRAIKRGTEAARTEAARAVSKDMGLKVGVVRKAINLTPPNYESLTGELRASLRRIPRYEFDAKGPNPSRGKGRGVTYRSEGGRKTVPGAFISTMPSGHTGVFKRKGAGRLPIRQLYGPSIGRVFDRYRDRIAQTGSEAAEKELDRQLNRLYGVK